MPTIVVKTQADLDALPARFEAYTTIEIRGGSRYDRIVVRQKWENSSVEAWGNSSVVARENSSVVARENSSVEAWENSSVVARGNSSVVAWGNSSVVARGNSSVVAWGNSSVEAWGNSSVVAWANSSVEAWENSSVVARENSSVVARGNSSVVAWENSSVVAWGNSSVEAWGNSSVEAWENSSVEAWGNSSVVAFEFSMIAVLAATVVLKKLKDYCMVSLRGVLPAKPGERDKTVTVKKTPATMTYTKEMFVDRAERDGKDHVLLYKMVDPKDDRDFYSHKVEYKGIVECPDFDPNPDRECGGGLHLSPTKGCVRSYQAHGKMLKCRVAIEDLVVYPKKICKVRCRKVEVLGTV
jgi:hypothetical protein